MASRKTREQLQVTGDIMLYRGTDDSSLLNDPFEAFSEWTSEVDQKAYGAL